MKVIVYAYQNCDTCRRALKFLEARGVRPSVIPIREQPPTLAELRLMLTIYQGDLKRLFNTSGRDYQALGLKDKLTGMTVDSALLLLSQNGNLVKRPFLLVGERGRVGFVAAEWEELI